MTLTETPNIELSSPKVMHDEVVEISVTGLEPWARVTLRLTTTIDGIDFVSWADFFADAAGRVDIASQAPVAGSYRATDAMGLFWSMMPEATDLGPMAGPRPDPWELQPPQAYELTALVDGHEVASASLKRVVVAEEVTARRIHEGRLRGVLFLPPGDGPHSALLALTGSGGGYPSEIAAALAGRGFAVLALAYFNAPDLPDHLVNIPLEYFEEGLQRLAARPEVDAERLGVIGGSRGGELALLLGSRFPQIRAVVAKVPSHVVWPGCCSEEALRQPGWTWGGEPLTAMPLPEITSRAKDYWPEIRDDWLGFYWLALGNAEAEEKAAIPVEKINGPVLMITGGDDRCWPATYMADRVMERLQANDFPHPCVHLRYDNSGHAAGGSPYWPAIRFVNPVHPLLGEPIALGGTVESVAHSSVDSWKKTLEFLRKHIG